MTGRPLTIAEVNDRIAAIRESARIDRTSGCELRRCGRGSGFQLHRPAGGPARRADATARSAIFEVQPEQGKFDEYPSLAEFLPPKLEAIDGFVEINRFANERRRVLSLSIWRDEKAVVRWRTQAAQEKGRFEAFEDHHLRVGEVIADSAPPAGLAVVEQRFDATEAGRAKVVTLTELIMRGGHRHAVPKPI